VAFTNRRVSSLMRGLSFSALDTVEGVMFNAFAILPIVAFFI
jgi:hypothetical protein